MSYRHFWSKASVWGGTPWEVPPSAPNLRVFLCRKLKPNVTVKAGTIPEARRQLWCDVCSYRKDGDCPGPMLLE